MDSTSLTKPVDLQGLSLALAKTKADYEGKINQIAGNLHANVIVLTDVVDTNNVTSDIGADVLYNTTMNDYFSGNYTNCFPVTVIYNNDYYAGSIEYYNTDIINYTLSFGDYKYRTNTSPYTEWLPVVDIGADWNEIDNYSKQYISNKPAIKAGEGENSVLIGQIESSDQTAEYSINITGDAKATTFSYTPNGTDLTFSAIGWAAYLSTAVATRQWQLITSVDPNNHTITFADYYSTSAISNEVLIVYNNYNKLASGSASCAEGKNTIAGGNQSHAEGSSTKALGAFSHAEGSSSVATKSYSHAEGQSTRSYGIAAHAEGAYCMATNNDAHAEGYNTIAASKYQHVQGKFNIEDALDVYADIVGNGESNARSNAYTLDWSGNGWYAGKVSAGTVESPANPTAANDLATKAYVDAATADVSPYLSDLMDTDISNKQGGQTLIYNERSAKWVNMDIPNDSIRSLQDTTISDPPTDGQVLQYDATNNIWVNATLPTGVTETRVNELIAAALAQYGDGDTATYGYNDASEVNY